VDERTRRILPRFRYGNILPHDSGAVHRGPGYQFYHLVPHDIMEVSTVLGLEDYAVEKVEQAMENYWRCVELLVREKADVIVLGGVPISAQLGRTRVLQLIGSTKERFGVTVDASLEAVLSGSKHLGLKSIAVGSRWGGETNRAVTRYLEEGGLKVAGITDRGQRAADAAAMSFEDGIQTALEVAREAARGAPDAEAVFVPGAAAMSLHVIPAMEEEFGKIGITNLSAEVWNNLVRPGVIAPIHGWGKLLATR
jgi:maleate cis-trans isomerase